MKQDIHEMIPVLNKVIPLRSISFKIYCSGGRIELAGFSITCRTGDCNKFSNAQMDISLKKKLGSIQTCLADNH